MCRNIKRLFNYNPPATDDEIRAASIQFVRKISGSTRPSRVNAEAFDKAVKAIADASQELLNTLVTTAEPRNRQADAAKARERSASRFA